MAASSSFGGVDALNTFVKSHELLMQIIGQQGKQTEEHKEEKKAEKKEEKRALQVFCRGQSQENHLSRVGTTPFDSRTPGD